MLEIQWMGEFEDCDGRVHAEYTWFIGKSMDDIHNQIRDYVAQRKSEEDLCLVYTEICQINDTRN